MLWNVWSLCGNLKFQFILQTMIDANIHIACITESWLTDGHDHIVANIESLGYKISHFFRTGKKGGGVAILTHKSLTVKCIKFDLCYESFEWHGIRYFGDRVYCILCIYRKQEVSTAIFFNEFTEFITLVCNSFSDPIIITGDFNFHYETNDKPSRDLKDLALNYGLQQLVQGATQKFGGHTLDLVFSNPCDISVKTEVHADLIQTNNPFIKFDHFPVLFQVQNTAVGSAHQSVTETQYVKRNIKQINFDEFKNHLHEQFNPVNTSNSISNFAERVDLYNTRLSNVLDHFAPAQLKVVSVNNQKEHPKWFDQEYRDQRRLRRKLERQNKILKTDVSLQAYVKQRDHCVVLANAKQRMFYRNILASTNDPSTLFQTVSELWNKKKVKALPTYTGDAKTLANDFNTFFTSKVSDIRNCISSNEPFLPEPENNMSESSSELQEFKLATLEELHEIVHDKEIKTSFDDPIPAPVYKECMDVLLPHLLDLVNCSLLSGDMSGLKESTIIPLLKKAKLDHEAHKNYRPLFNLQFLSKLVEKVVLKRLTDHMTLNDLHCPSQFGYKKHHSTENLLLQVVDETLIGFDKNTATILILLDMSSAFDTVDLQKLLSILEHRLRIKGTALKWFQSFLIGRKQKVIINGVVSELLVTLYGVPQGSVLGPVLFNIYVSSLSSVFKELGIVSSSYADDTNARIRFSLAFQYANIAVMIPRMMKKLSTWMNDYFLKLNPGKTEIIFLCPSHLEPVTKLNGVTIDDQCIRFSERVELLGLHIDKALNFDYHVSQLVSSCHYHLNNISKIKRYLTASDTEKLMHAFISSKLDYSNSVLNGINCSISAKLQSVQNRAARIVLDLPPCVLVTDDMLQDLHWLKLDQRIVFKILLLTHKFFMNMAPTYVADKIFVIDCDERLLNVIYLDTRYGRRSFSYCAPRYWNCLPKEIRTLNDTLKFKSCIKTVLFTNRNDIMQAALGYRAFC